MSDPADGSPLQPGVDWKEFSLGQLENHLAIAAPPFTLADEAFRQLRYVERYADDRKCKSLAIESHYIDRDHMEDHSVFYSKSLYPYPNFCKRVHFFSIGTDEAKERLGAIVQTGINGGINQYRAACKQFSEEAYLGFVVIKPLHGSPVGRTVLRCLGDVPDAPSDKQLFRRDFGCTRSYTSHFAGVELTVRGLAFQQQDVGVSACATTAIWSALQKVSDHEEIATATPAQITMLASKYSLPHGRAMPSEGLSVDQMCQAVQAAGIAPNLFRVDDGIVARAYLYSAVKSGFAPILILENSIGRHAVTVVGMKVSVTHQTRTVATDVDDAANDLMGLYIHDDRYGPYLRADLAHSDADRNREMSRGEPKQQLALVIPLRSDAPQNPSSPEGWTVTHVLIPMHAKIRLSFSGLRHVANRAASAVLRYRDTFQIPATELPEPTVIIDTWIIRAHKYIESIFLGNKEAVPDRVSNLCTTISLARYLGIVRLSARYLDPIDIVVDTTSTRRNVHCLGIVVVKGTSGHTALMARYLATVYACPLFI